MSSSWCYRVVRHSEDQSLGVYEVYSDSGGVITGMTEDPIIVGDDIPELNRCLVMILDALTAHQILDEEDVLGEASRAPLDLDSSAD